MTLQQFTNREIDCIKALMLGKTANDTAKDLGISSRTVETHIDNIRKKLGVRYKSEIVSKMVSDKHFSSLLLKL